ncbi:isocitrate lyase/PEP mutase family protein [Halorarum halobium]|uniref:isocitrate lyase/PEP mutase family protein n=1 Tax=Halorarum halobium TaxID=3075121 RepID=UPI0028A692E1|nr:isocitrate lyase/phosphoenolpyruvate mutase family protein [Halobaculum sp. XH14]
MRQEIQRNRAESFRERHSDAADGPLVLPNAWDAASAIVYETLGFAAVGSSSAGVAASLGLPDGEVVGRDEMLAAVGRMADAVDLPVSADVEAGYGDGPEAVAETVRLTIEAGAVGVNLEDGTGDPDDPLVDVETHAAKIRAAREAAEEAGIPLAINGRTDVFWSEVGDGADRVARTVERANAYREAGSDCLFVPGVTDPEEIEALVDGIDGPINVLGGPGAPSVPELGNLGVARVSVGSGPMRATLVHLRDVGEELREDGTYGGMENAIPYGDLAELLRGRVDHGADE